MSNNLHMQRDFKSFKSSHYIMRLFENLHKVLALEYVFHLI